VTAREPFCPPPLWGGKPLTFGDRRKKCPFPPACPCPPPPTLLPPKGERGISKRSRGERSAFSGGYRRVPVPPLAPHVMGGGKREEVPAPFGDRRSFYGGNRPPFLPPSMRLRRITLIRCPEGTGCGGMGVRRDPSRSPFGPPMLWGGESGRKCRPPRSLSRLGAQGKSLPLFQG
jgi:hypothetical protein